jgi:glutamyl-tRNA reductase
VSPVITCLGAGNVEEEGVEGVAAALIDLREAPTELALPAASTVEALSRLPQGEALLLATCQRLELYQVGEPEPAAWLARARGTDERKLRPWVRELHGRAALTHLFRVAAGLDSAALGESEILGQLTAALNTAERVGRLGPLLGWLGRTALHVGRRARAETGLCRGSLSMFGAALELASAVLGSLEGRAAVVLGGGHAAERMLDLLAGRRLARLIQVRRRPDPVRGREVRGWDALQECLDAADLVVSAVSAGGVVAAAQLRRRPLAVVDLGMPPNVQRPATGSGLHLIDLADVEERCRRNRAQRQSRARAAEAMVERATEEAVAWLRARRAAPGMAVLREWAEVVRQREVAAIARRRGWTGAELEAVESLTRHLVDRLLQPSLEHLRSEGPKGAYGSLLTAATSRGAPPPLAAGWPDG